MNKITTVINDDLRKRLEELSAETGISMSKYAQLAIEKSVKNNLTYSVHTEVTVKEGHSIPNTVQNTVPNTVQNTVPHDVQQQFRT